MKKNNRYKICTLVLVFMMCIGLSGTASNVILYREKADCFWCGDSGRNILNAYREGIGVLRMNQWSVSSFPLLPEDCTSGNSTTSGGGEGASVVSMSGGYDRRMGQASISLSESSKPSPRDMATFLCEDCARKAQEEHEYDVALIDFETRELIPLVTNRTLFFIKDYAVHMDWDLESEGANITILAFYAPPVEQKDNDTKLRELERRIQEYEAL